MPHTGYQHVVHDYYIDRLEQLRAGRQKRLQQVRTRAQARCYQAEVRRAIRRAFAPLPRRTPLNAHITGSIQCRHHRLEKILFESRPGCLVMQPLKDRALTRALALAKLPASLVQRR
jgi:hypothetical protein